MTQNEKSIITPRQLEYWELEYRQLALLPDWSELSAGDRARKLLERIEAKLSEVDAPPQIKALLGCSEQQRLDSAHQIIAHFEGEANS
jgi:enoyl reductase-like protein